MCKLLLVQVSLIREFECDVCSPFLIGHHGQTLAVWTLAIKVLQCVGSSPLLHTLSLCSRTCMSEE